MTWCSPSHRTCENEERQPSCKTSPADEQLNVAVSARFSDDVHAYNAVLWSVIAGESEESHARQHEDPPHWPQLSWHYQARGMQDWHHAWIHPHTW
jgi:hypothetical protein